MIIIYYKKYIMNIYLSKLRKNPNTSRAGEIWTLNEDNLLMERIKIYGYNGLNDISSELNRTINSVKYRILENAIKYINENNFNLNEVSIQLNIPLNKIESYKKMLDDKEQWKNIISRTKKRIRIE